MLDELHPALVAHFSEFHSSDFIVNKTLGYQFPSGKLRCNALSV